MSLNASPDALSIDNARLPFQEQIDYFRGKAGLNLPTEHFDDIKAEAHERAFVVAQAQKADLLTDFYNAVEKAIEDGKSIDWFRKQFGDIVQTHGWAYNGSASFRTRTIYETNMLTSYAKGRDAQLADPDLQAARPWLQYNLGAAERHRPLHASWAGLTLRHDDPWIEAHRPVKAWGCHCWLQAVAAPAPGRDTAPKEETYEVTDRHGDTHTIPAGVDYGFHKTSNKTGGPWEPDYRDYPEAIGRALKESVAGAAPAPQGTPVSEALTLPRKGEFADRLRDAVAAVDSVHGDGALPKIPVNKSSGRRDVGGLWTQGQTATKITVSENSPHPELTMAHEIGHLLHHQAMGKAGSWAMDDLLWKDWAGAVEDSDAIAQLAELPPDKFRDYLLDPVEVWARSYSQWVAARSQNKAMLDGIAFVRGAEGPYRHSQWGDADFEPIAEAIDAMFKQLGWVK